MGKLIAIEEGGIKRYFKPDRLETRITDGTTARWKPREDASVVGKKDGKTYKVSNIGGNLDYFELPEKIRIVAAPTKTTYDEGDVVNYSGMIVKAYKKNGALWTHPQYPNGVIPFRELIIPTTIDEYIVASRYSDIDTNGIIEYPLYVAYDEVSWEHIYKNGSRKGTMTSAQIIERPMLLIKHEGSGYESGGKQYILLQEDIMCAYYPYDAIDTKLGTTRLTFILDGSVQSDDINDVYVESNPVTTYTHNGKTSKGAEPIVALDNYQDAFRPEVKHKGFVNEFKYKRAVYARYTNEIMWTMLYGEQGITVKWPRYGDGEILKAFFTITIAKGFSGEPVAGGGGEAGDNGTGRND